MIINCPFCSTSLMFNRSYDKLICHNKECFGYYFYKGCTLGLHGNYEDFTFFVPTINYFDNLSIIERNEVNCLCFDSFLYENTIEVYEPVNFKFLTKIKYFAPNLENLRETIAILQEKANQIIKMKAFI